MGTSKLLPGIVLPITESWRASLRELLFVRLIQDWDQLEARCAPGWKEGGKDATVRHFSR